MSAPEVLGIEAAGLRFVGRRGWQQRGWMAAARRATAVYCVEGRHVTMAQIAEVLGLPVRAARKAYATAVKADGPVTWAQLLERRAGR